MSVINTNLGSLRAQFAVSQANRGLAQSMQALSTGQRINSAADDAAGLAISNRMSSQIRGMDKALNNIADACSMLQTAEGATAEITAMLQRMRELTVQSLNATMAESDRQSVDQEFQQLKQQIDTIANATQWGGTVTLLNLQQQVLAGAVPAVRTGQGELDTRGLPSGNYQLFVNGVEVNVAFVKDELPDARLGKIINAIHAGRAVHGAVADLSGNGSVSLSTPDGRDLAIWYNSSVPGLSAASFGLGRLGAQAQVSEISLVNTSAVQLTQSRQTTHVEYSLPAGAGDLSLTPVNQPDTTAGSLSVVGNTVYRGLGATAQAFGVIDAVKNGQAGQPLRINLLSPFVNGSFEGGTLGSSVVPGWSVKPERVLLDGTQTIAGFPTPVDNRSESLSYMDVPGAYTAALSNASVAPGSTQSMMLKSTGLVVDSNGVSHGPYIVSEALYVPGGESVSFKWRATGDTDAFDVYAYLLNVDSGATQPLLNRTGASLTDATSWVTNTTTINQSGNYKFVFVSGSYDLTGGRATGATLFVDDVQLSGSPPTQKPSSAELDRLYQMVQSQSDATGLQASFELQGQPVSSGPSATAAEATAALKRRIDTLSRQGQLQGVAAEVVGGKLRLTSRFPGEPLSLAQLAVSNPIYTATQAVVQAATAGVDQATGLPGAQAQSVGADITAGVPAKEDLVRNAGRLIYQVGANDGDTLEYTFQDFTGEQGFMDELTWDASSRRLSRAEAIASAQGQEAVNDAQQSRSQIVNANSANLALVLLDEMMQKVDERRSSLGAALNRLQSAGNNVSVGVIEQSSSRSQLQDADYAKSAAALAKNQIIQSAASAVLAQANATNKDILKLLEF